MKRIFALVAAITIMFSSVLTRAQQAPATRGTVCQMLLKAADYYNPGVEKGDILKGYEDGELHEERPVTRAEALVMLKRAFGDLPESVGHNARVALKAENFTDIPDWAAMELSEVFECGIVAGTAENTFSPDNNVTVEQMQLFIKRVYALYATNIKDDFYATVNKEQLEDSSLQDDEYISGTLYDLQKSATNQVNEIIELLLKGSYKKGTPEQKIVDFYECAADIETRNENAAEPIAEYLDKIDSVRNIGELSLIQTVLSEELCVYPFMEFSLSLDMRDSTKYILSFKTMEPIMPRDVYIAGDSAEKEAYINYLKTLLILGGQESEEAQKNALSYFEFEKKLAEKMPSAMEKNDAVKTYNTYSAGKLDALFPDFDMDSVIECCGLTREDKILITAPQLAEEFASLYNQSNIDVLKTAARISLLAECGKYLSEEFSDAEEELNSKITGTDGKNTPRQRALSATRSVMSDYLGEMYVKEYFDVAVKDDMEKLVYDITSVFKNRIDALEWMSEDTRERAKLKLDSIRVKIGCGQGGASYLDNAQIEAAPDGGTYFNNMLAVKKARKEYYSHFQAAAVNRDAWAIAPYTVNASYNPTLNDITFPAAILSAPLYDKNAAYEENLGGIGYIIAHEIAHAFDSNGVRFDENGNLHDWWSDEEYAAYSLLCARVEEFYDGEEAISAIPANGQLTLNENIADIGAAVCVTELAKSKGADLKLLYTSMARAFAATKTREYALFASKTDTHSDDKLRINRVLVNLDEFYETFEITQDDGMYVEAKERIKLW